MKKLILFLFVQTIGGPLYCSEVKTPEKYEKPTSIDDAEQKLKEAHDEKTLADEQYNKLTEKFNTINTELKGKLTDPERKEKQDELNAVYTTRDQVEKERTEWAERATRLEQDVAKLKVLENPIETVTGFKRLVAQISRFVKENITLPFIQRFLNDDTLVMQTRQELNTIYNQLGDEALFARARNNKELAAAFKDVSGKMGSLINALSDYRESVKKGLVDEATVSKEMQDVVSNLIGLTQELQKEGVDQEARNIIVREIDETLKVLGMSAVERVNFENKVNIIVAPTNPQAINQLLFSIEGRTPDIANELVEDPINFIKSDKFKQFIKDLMKLENVDQSKLKLEENTVPRTLKNAYEEMYTNLLRAATNPDRSLENRQQLGILALELQPKYVEAQEKFNTRFSDMLEAKAREATENELGGSKPLTKDFVANMNKSLTNKFDIFVKNYFSRPDTVSGRSDQFLKAWNVLDNDINQWMLNVDNAAVSQESLNVRQALVDNYLKVREHILSPKRMDAPSFAELQVLVDIQKKVESLMKDLELDRSILVVIKQEVQKEKQQTKREQEITNIELVKAAERPEDLEGYAQGLVPLAIRSLSDAVLKNLQKNSDVTDDIKKLIATELSIRGTEEKPQKVPGLLLAIKSDPARGLIRTSQKGPLFKTKTEMDRTIDDVVKARDSLKPSTQGKRPFENWWQIPEQTTPEQQTTTLPPGM